MQVEVETGQVLSQVGAVHDQRSFGQKEEVVAPFGGPQGSRDTEPKRPRTGCQHSILTIAENRVVARWRIIRPDPRHADRRRFPLARDRSTTTLQQPPDRSSFHSRFTYYASFSASVECAGENNESRDLTTNTVQLSNK